MNTIFLKYKNKTSLNIYIAIYFCARFFTLCFWRLYLTEMSIIDTH